MTVEHDPSLGTIVAMQPAAAGVLERFGLDYCCNGERTLAEACAADGIDVEAVTSALEVLDSKGDVGWTTLDPPALADHIVDTHHRYLHEELPLLDHLAAKVLSVHGDRHPELVEVRRLTAAIHADLASHLLKEERVLFPAIHAVAEGRADFPFGPITNSIRMMTTEHDRAGELLAELRTAACGYVVPADACGSFQSWYERLEALELDTHVHVHKENHLLFPAAVRLAGG